MGGPSCSILLLHRLSDAEVRSLGSLLEPFGEVKPEGDLLAVLGGPAASGDPRERVPPCVEVALEDAVPAGFPLLEQAAAALAARPRQMISAWGTTRAVVNHRFLGNIALVLAERFEGWVHLLTVCHLDAEGPAPPAGVQDKMNRFLSRLHPEDRDLPASKADALEAAGAELGPWMEEVKRWNREKVRERVARMPGRVVELEGQDGDVSYLVDARYLREWLADPNFYIE